MWPYNLSIAQSFEVQSMSHQIGPLADLKGNLGADLSHKLSSCKGLGASMCLLASITFLANSSSKEKFTAKITSVDFDLAVTAT